MAELMYLHLLVTVTTTKETKQKLIATVLGFMRTPVELPDELVPALGHGLVNPGTYFNTGRWAQLGFLIELGIKFKGLGSAERSEVMGDPWAFRDMAYSITGQGPLLNDTPCCISSSRRISRRSCQTTTSEGSLIAFVITRQGKTDDPARQIQEIRDALTPRYGKGFDFYDIRLRPLWQDQEDPWPELVGWARKFTESPAFDEEERTYKLEAVGLLADAPNAVRSERRVAGARDQGCDEQQEQSDALAGQRLLQEVDRSGS
ncbi:MAG: hypothetical protein M5U31_16165 [Acidimicrobiia bacterium]|nr:hypothetical protein [Acidimicrobiia bacterium]